MSAQVYSVPGQTEGKGKAFLEWGKAESYPINHLLHEEGGNVNYYKSVHHPILLEGKEGPF